MQSADRYPLLVSPYELAAAAPDLPVVAVGDALSPRTLLDATAEGARAGATVSARRPALV